MYIHSIAQAILITVLQLEGKVFYGYDNTYPNNNHANQYSITFLAGTTIRTEPIEYLWDMMDNTWLIHLP